MHRLYLDRLLKGLANHREDAKNAQSKWILLDGFYYGWCRTISLDGNRTGLFSKQLLFFFSQPLG